MNKTPSIITMLFNVSVAFKLLLSFYQSFTYFRGAMLYVLQTWRAKISQWIKTKTASL